MSRPLNPYAPPSAELDSSAAGPRRRRTSRALLLASVTTFSLTLAVAMVVHHAERVAPIGFMAASGLAAAGCVTGIAALFAAPSSWMAAGAGSVANLGMMLLGALATWLSTATFSRGRQLRSFGRVLLARVETAGDWAALSFEVSADAELRAGLAAEWRENGRTEHASVGAFARLTLDLMALGAPPALVASANRDALDEIRHTELCFSIARALDGKSEGPGPFPEAKSARTLIGGRTLALAALAVDSLVDGALHEGVSARVGAKLARRCEEPTIRAALKEIGADEGRHAAHGWDVVEWCLAEGGALVAHALAGALRALPDRLETSRPVAAAGGAWERYGIVGSALEADELAKARADVVRRVGAMISTKATAGAAA